MSRFAAASLASRLQGHTTRHAVSAFVVEAVSKHEAEGKALAIARKGLKPSEGWYGHHVNVCSADNVIDPDSMNITCTETN